MSLREFAEDRVHPRGSEPDILQKFLTLACGDRAFEMLAALARHMRLTQRAKGLDQQTAQSACRRHIPGGCSLQLDRHRSDLQRPAWAISQEDRLAGHLFGQSERVGGISSRRLDACAVAAGKRFCHHLRGWKNSAKKGVIRRQVVDPSRKSANNSFPSEAVKRHINRVPAADLQEISRDKYAPRTAAFDRG